RIYKLCPIGGIPYSRASENVVWKPPTSGCRRTSGISTCWGFEKFGIPQSVHRRCLGERSRPFRVEHTFAFRVWFEILNVAEPKSPKPQCTSGNLRRKTSGKCRCAGNGAAG